MKKLIAIILAVITALSLVGCGDPEGPSGPSGNGRPQGTKIYICAGGSSEFAWTNGTKEDEVIEYIEQKYYEDTNISLDFEINLNEGQGMKGTLSTGIADGSVDVAISHTRGGDGIDDWAFINNYYTDLTFSFEDYLQDAIDDDVFTWTDGVNTFDGLKAVTTPDDELIGIPSIINPYKFGILVRKDWMEQAGYTDDINDKSKTYVGDFETFTAMAKAMKTQQNLEHVITGDIFDVEKAGVLGACGINAGYYSNTVYSEGGKNYVGLGIINPGYKDVVELENNWAKEGLMAAEPSKIKIVDGETNFMTGKTGIFLQDPTVTHLIEVARKTKAMDPSAEFTVLGALTKTPESTDKGFMRNTVATFCAFIPKASQHIDAVLKFMNWVYSSKDNYLLCRYGREGVDWHYDEDNQTYSYNSEQDFVNPPYSGILALVENQNMADLTYAGYTNQEKQWIENAKNKDFYVTNDTIDYMLLTNNSTLKTANGNAQVTIGPIMRELWYGTYQGTNPGQTYLDARTAFVGTAEPYLEAMYNVYTSLKSN
ncbi:MAG: extracellular solute-binding protein [Clostridiales bacterium]|nr:extracellular solute-binding protein [Clostridiales bacterium]